MDCYPLMQVNKRILFEYIYTYIYIHTTKGKGMEIS